MGTKCEICDISFAYENELQMHRSSKKHMKNNSYKNSIYVGCIPYSVCIDDLIKLFSHFGEVIKHKPISNDHNDLIIEFKNHEPVEIILSRTISIDNIELGIRPAKYYDHKEVCTKELSYDNIKNSFNVKESFDIQLTAFLDIVSITEYDIKTRYEPVCQALDKVFQTIFPKCKSYSFGSTLIGLGVKNSDLDIYFSAGLPVIEENSCNSGPHVISVDKLFSVVERTLQKHPKKFSKCIPIPQARMPIIKFVYVPTKVHCDISFKNNLAVHNSQLVKFYLSTDLRFQPLMMIIKYWIFNCDLSSRICITKYALTMLFIFYLQQIKYVPPIFFLQQECAVPITVKGWQVNFDKTLIQFKIKNDYKNKCIPELLEGFFQFYAIYDFKSNVICPGDGHSYNKELFENIQNLPSSMMRYKEYVENTESAFVLYTWKPMCLQDPIELNNNLTKGINKANLEKFQTHCSIATNIVKDSSKNNYQDLLQNLFNYTKYTVINHSDVKEKRILFSIYPTEFSDMKTSLNILRNELFIKNNWFDITFSMIKQYLEEVLNLQVKINHSNGWPNQQKFEDETSINSKSPNVIVLHCKGTHILWFNRKNVKVDGTFMNPLQKEKEISKTILREIHLRNDSPNIIIDFECHLLKNIEPSMHISITLLDKGCTQKIFCDLGNHVISKMPSIIKKNFNIMRVS